MDFVDEGGDAFIGGLQRLEAGDKGFTISNLRALAALRVPELRLKLINHVVMGACTMKSVVDLCDNLVHEQWVSWHWSAAPDSIIRPEKSMHRAVCCRPVTPVPNVPIPVTLPLHASRNGFPSVVPWVQHSSSNSLPFRRRA